MTTFSRIRSAFRTSVNAIKNVLIVPTVLFILSAAPAHAQFRNPLGTLNVPEVIGRIVSWLGGLAGSLFFLYLLWGGVQWMTAGGDGKKVADAQGKIKAAASGIIVILFAYIIIAAVIGIVPH